MREITTLEFVDALNTPAMFCLKAPLKGVTEILDNNRMALPVPVKAITHIKNFKNLRVILTTGNVLEFACVRLYKHRGFLLAYKTADKNCYVFKTI